MKNAFNVIVNIILVVVALACSVVVYQHYSKMRAEAAANKTYAPGDQLPALQGASFDKERSVVVIANSTCKYCSESMPFYKTIEKAGIIVVSTTDDLATANMYWSEHRVTPRIIVPRAASFQPTEKAPMRVKGTPTLLVVDKGGKVYGEWIGLLRPEQEEEVRKALKITS